MRLSLGCFQTVASDDQDVQKILEGIHLSANGELTLVPKSHKWSAESIRHKTRRAYLYGKKNYLVTVSCVETYKIRAGHSRQATITLTQKDWEEHYELEVLQTCMIDCCIMSKGSVSEECMHDIVYKMTTVHACWCIAPVCDELAYLSAVLCFFPLISDT